MSWLLPSALAIAGLAALAAIALHFIARSRPLAEALPTARFVPQRPVRARTRSLALSDIPLLLLRLAALLIIGAAVAGPVLTSTHGRIGRVVVVDRSHAVRDVAELRDSVRALMRPGDVLIAFDSSATAVRGFDSLTATGARGSLSAALASAVTAGVTLAPQVDSIELALVSPFAADEVDDATSHIRAAWPGRVRVVRLRAAAAPALSPRVESRVNPNDAILAGLSLMGVVANTGNVRLVRGVVSAADSAWARADGHVLLHWAVADSGAVVWRKRPHIDAIGGVVSSTGTLVARFPRLWLMDGEAVARWADGEPAAVENATGAGCIRDVGVLIDPSSDVTLRAPFRAFAAGLLAPCGGPRASATLSDSALAVLSGGGSLAAGSALRDRGTQASAWTPWLLLLGALLLLLELALRRTDRAIA